jgi:predicted transcriptional regulator
METLEKKQIAPKPVLMGVLNEYGGIIDNIGLIIDESGIKAQYIAKRLDIPESIFYHKKRNKSFSFPEVRKIVEMLGDDETFENNFLIEMAKNRLNDENGTLEDFYSA